MRNQNRIVRGSTTMTNFSYAHPEDGEKVTIVWNDGIETCEIWKEGIYTWIGVLVYPVLWEMGFE